jgi:hypothetical protein
MISEKSKIDMSELEDEDHPSNFEELNKSSNNFKNE